MKPRVDRRWSRPKVAIATLAAIAIGVAAFAFRFNALGGALGGFDNDHFTRLIRADVLLEGQQPLRDFVDAELRGAWPALTYQASAWAQQIGGRTLLPEAYLTVSLLALAHTITFLLALDLSRRWSVALLAVVVAIATMPKVHNYPKVLSLALGVWALRAVALNPSAWRLAAAALATAIATLFRHDYGVYVAAGVLAAVVVRDVERPRSALRSVGLYVTFTSAFLLPSAIWVQIYDGIPTYLRNALVTVAAERTRTPLRFTEFDWMMPLTGEGPEAITYYGFWAALAILLVWLVAAGGLRTQPGERGTAAGLLAMAALVNVFFLRANPAARFGDAAVPIVLLAACAVGVASAWRWPALRVPATALPVALLLMLLCAGYIYGDVRRELDTSGLSDSWGKITRRYQAVRSELSALPPVDWSRVAAQDPLQAARYVAACTNDGDHLLVIGRLHEIPVLARRPFAAGQPLFELSLYTSDAHQRLAVERLQTQSVPIILGDTEDLEGGFNSDYPLVAAYVAEKYREVGTIDVDGEPRYRVLARSDRAAVRTDSVLGLPCFR